MPSIIHFSEPLHPFLICSSMSCGQRNSWRISDMSVAQSIGQPSPFGDMKSCHDPSSCHTPSALAEWKENCAARQLERHVQGIFFPSLSKLHSCLQCIHIYTHKYIHIYTHTYILSCICLVHVEFRLPFHSCTSASISSAMSMGSTGSAIVMSAEVSTASGLLPPLPGCDP